MAEPKISQRTMNGSGYIYVRKADEDTYPLPEQASWEAITAEEETALQDFLKELCTDDNELGYLKGGYTFTETLTPVSDQSDMGQIKLDDIQSEEATNAFSLFNGNGETIAKMHPLAATAKGTGGTRVTNIGGISNKDDSVYDIAFIHPDTKEGDIVLLTRGKNISGLTLGFVPDSNTPLPCTYTAQPLDQTGHLCKVVEMPVGFKWDNSYSD